MKPIRFLCALALITAIGNSMFAQTETQPRKARVAVVPAIYAQEARPKFMRELKDTWGVTDMSIIENVEYTTYLVDSLVNCRKFDVLERADLDPVIKELNLGASDYGDHSKVVALGKMLNADYVVVPEIRYIGILRDREQVPYVGEQLEVYKAKLSSNLRTVDVATSQIVSSSIDAVEVKKKMRKIDDSPAAPLRDFMGELYRASALKETAKIIDVAYPIKVLAVSEKTCVLNRGEGAIKEGETLEVYKPGEVMIDPDTKENLGYSEELVGRLRVVKVEVKTCTAEIQEGSGTITKLDICRRVQEAQLPSAQPQPAPKID